VMPGISPTFSPQNSVSPIQSHSWDWNPRHTITMSIFITRKLNALYRRCGHLQSLYHFKHRWDCSSQEVIFLLSQKLRALGEAWDGWIYSLKRVQQRVYIPGIIGV
jgi:hypothetical protein